MMTKNLWIASLLFPAAVAWAVPRPAGDREPSSTSFWRAFDSLSLPGAVTVLLPASSVPESGVKAYLLAGRLSIASLRGMSVVTALDGTQWAVTVGARRLWIGEAELVSGDERRGESVLVHRLDGPLTARSIQVRALPVEAEFRPLSEASLPEGFPAPGPVGVVTLKDYPRYRAARTAGGVASFWTLFGHIKRNQIAMTAPVEMTLDAEAGMVSRDMAFLYERPELGSAGRQGPVEVVDLEPTTVLSVGLRGPLDKSGLERAKAAIQARLGGRWQAAGAWRLMGYNSPMVPASKRYFELQVPIHGCSEQTKIGHAAPAE